MSDVHARRLRKGGHVPDGLRRPLSESSAPQGSWDESAHALRESELPIILLSGAVDGSHNFPSYRMPVLSNIDHYQPCWCINVYCLPYTGG